MDNLSEHLTQVPVFSKLTSADRAELARLARRGAYQKGGVICRQGDVWPNMLFLASGYIEWTILSPEGKRLVAFEMGAGEVVCGHSFFDDLPMPASLEVLEACQVYHWSRETMVPILSRSTEAVWDVTRLLVKYMRRARIVLYGFAFQPVAGRLAQLLLTHYTPAEGQPVSRDLTLDEMAAAVGTSRELVCKLLYRFADEGMIRINRTEFVFTDRARLEELAGQS